MPLVAILSTVVVEGPLALRTRRLEAARSGEIGMQIVTLPQLAARLAGGFARPAQGRPLDEAARAALGQADLTALAPLRDLPGMVRALVRTLERLWRADVALGPQAEDARLRDLAALDAHVRAALPRGMLAPPDLVRAATARVALAPQVLGPVRFEHVHELPPVWRPLVAAIAEVTPLAWSAAAGSGGAPEDLAPALAPPRPAARLVACADPQHEVVEALRWARALMADQGVRPAEIAIVAASPEPWDDHLLALSAAADFPVHFSHGVPLLATRDGQACAALADVLAHGLSQERVRRVLGHGAGRAPMLFDLPARPLAEVRRQALLGDLGQWRRALEMARSERDDGVDPEAALLPALELMAKGLAVAEAAGGQLLPSSAAAHWSAALAAAPAVALGFSLQASRVGDGRDPGANVVWAPARHLVGAPRPWVRMLGLTARAWPRPDLSDPLLPEHILALDPQAPISRAEADRRAFEAIAGAASAELVLSYGRRSRQGGRQAPSPLAAGDAEATVLRRMRVPEHAFSEADRLRARPAEAADTPALARAQTCWRARRAGALSPYDGLLRADHPAILRVLAQPQSPTSLRRLLRDPLGYVWSYVLRWRDGVHPASPLALDDRAFGDLVHLLLQHAVNALEPVPGFGRASEGETQSALNAAMTSIGQTWPLERATPPPLLWRYTLELARAFAWRALTLDGTFAPGTRSWTEIEFGDPNGPAAEADAPWDPRAPVLVSGTELTIRGAIDRLELSADDRGARVTDYKTGLPPKNPAAMVLAGGAELQRVLYAIAVRQHRPDARAQARLVFLNDETPIPHRLAGDELEAAIEQAVGALRAGVDLMRRGVALPGPDAETDWSPSRLPLPAVGEMYRAIKQPAFGRAFGAFDAVWRLR
ncbi:MAG TPA: PD-(D/E)XK nuclease family protein [Caulobacteraceae bacterium]